MTSFIGFLFGFAAVLALSRIMVAAVNRKGGCPECGLPVPQVRRPTSWRQALWGGWTCDGCGTEMDRYGNELPEQRRA